MKYKWLWALVLVFILLDCGITVWAISGNHAEEKNPRVIDLIESYGLLGAMTVSAVARSGAVGLGMSAQYILPNERLAIIPLAIALMLSAIPVVWNVSFLTFM